MTFEYAGLSGDSELGPPAQVTIIGHPVKQLLLDNVWSVHNVICCTLSHSCWEPKPLV